jgi:hypothetical protein
MGEPPLSSHNKSRFVALLLQLLEINFLCEDMRHAAQWQKILVPLAVVPIL